MNTSGIKSVVEGALYFLAIIAYLFLLNYLLGPILIY